LSGTSFAQSFGNEYGGKLLLTRGISAFEGSGGGALTPWALITGNETDSGIGATAHYTFITTNDFEARSFGAAVGFYDRFEVSYSRQAFDTRDAGAALGLGAGFTISQDVYGAKLKLFGDAVLDQDTWVPQVAVGAFYKRSNQPGLVRALGAEDNNGFDLYVTTSKLFLAQSTLIGATLRYTRANQTGFLGFGPKASLQPEVSVGYLLSKRLIIGGEYRFKPNNLAFANESDWFDAFIAYAPSDHITITAAYGNLGDVVTFENQQGIYLTLQVGF
jgi:hypothetical protein